MTVLFRCFVSKVAVDATDCPTSILPLLISQVINQQMIERQERAAALLAAQSPSGGAEGRALYAERVAAMLRAADEPRAFDLGSTEK